MLNANDHIGTRDILFISFDTLRYDVAVKMMAKGRTPFLQSLLPGGQWEKRHSPGSFTYTAHHGFFAGFLPTPETPGPHERLFALRFPGSETTGNRTAVFDAPDIIAGLRARNYESYCIGGVGFFNKLTPLGSVLPNMFDASIWSPEMGVTDPKSQDHQMSCAADYLSKKPPSSRQFLFINLSAMHQPNCHYVDGQITDNPDSQGAALAAVDAALSRHRAEFEKRKWLCIFTSDHGTAYGEDGFQGHRLAHETVWSVPYAEFLWG